jgi:hypothetical protein
VTYQTDPKNRLICPNCNALNPPGTIVCMSCGIRIEDFKIALPRLEQIKLSRAELHREQLEDEKKLNIQENNLHNYRSLRKLLLIWVTVVFALGLVVSAGAAVYANQVKQTREEQRILYETSLVCLVKEDYVCARDGFRTLMESGANFPGIRDDLNVAQYRLARQYFDSGQWESTVQELNELLKRDPGNEDALDMLKASYDQWINQLGLEGRLIQRWMVRRERDARFPPLKD